MLDLFIPNSAPGSSLLLEKLTNHSIINTIPLIASVIDKPKDIINSHDFLKISENEKKFSDYFSYNKSDKSGNFHSYHLIYSRICDDIPCINSLLEIGLGTNDISIASNMGSGGTPGASLRAFRDLLPTTQIYGADFDKKILFKEDKIETFFVDQTKPETVKDLMDKIPGTVDLIIEDGLHSPAANLAVLKYGLPKLTKGGWFVTEDIKMAALPVWQIISKILPEKYVSYIIKDNNNLVFAVKYKDNL